MKKLDNQALFKKLDPQGILASIEVFDQQIIQAWQEMKKAKIPAGYRRIDKIVVNGMGGSALGAQVIRTLFAGQLKVPLTVINGYQLPAAVDSKTLYVLSSYSGTTEEPLSTFSAAKKRRAKVFGISSGGTLGKWISARRLPGYCFKDTFNPSNQPRMGLGYSLGAQLGLFSRLGLIKLTDADIKEALKAAKATAAKNSENVPAAKNPAKDSGRAAFGPDADSCCQRIFGRQRPCVLQPDQ